MPLKGGGWKCKCGATTGDSDNSDDPHLEILRYMKARKRFFQTQHPNEYSRPDYFPMEVKERLDDLNDIQEIISRGEVGGLNTYLGKDASKTYKGIARTESARKAGLASKNKKPDWHSFLLHFKDDTWASLLMALNQDVLDLETLDYSGRIGKLYKDKKINIRVQELNYETEKVRFVGRDGKLLDIKSLKTIRNEHLKIRKK